MEDFALISINEHDSVRMKRHISLMSVSTYICKYRVVIWAGHSSTHPGGCFSDWSVSVRISQCPSSAVVQLLKYHLVEQNLFHHSFKYRVRQK